MILFLCYGNPVGWLINKKTTGLECARGQENNYSLLSKVYRRTATRNFYLAGFAAKVPQNECAVVYHFREFP